MKTLPNRVPTLQTTRAPLVEKEVDPFYSTSEWRDARELCKALHNYTCARCSTYGVRLVVDHKIEIKDGGAPLDQDNLEPLCYPCHGTKTGAARVARMRE